MPDDFPHVEPASSITVSVKKNQIGETDLLEVISETI